MKLVEVVLPSDLFNLLLRVVVPRATTSINKDSQGAGSESPAWAKEGYGLRSRSAETRRGEKEEEDEEEKEKEREEKGTRCKGR